MRKGEVRRDCLPEIEISWGRALSPERVDFSGRALRADARCDPISIRLERLRSARGFNRVGKDVSNVAPRAEQRAGLNSHKVPGTCERVGKYTAHAVRSAPRSTALESASDSTKRDEHVYYFIRVLPLSLSLSLFRYVSLFIFSPFHDVFPTFGIFLPDCMFSHHLSSAPHLAARCPDR